MLFFVNLMIIFVINKAEILKLYPGQDDASLFTFDEHSFEWEEKKISKTISY